MEELKNFDILLKHTCTFSYLYYGNRTAEYARRDVTVLTAAETSLSCLRSHTELSDDSNDSYG